MQAWGKSRGKTTRILVTITYSTHIQHQRYLQAFGRLIYRLVAIGWRSTSASCIRRCSSDECSTESSSSRPPPYSNQTVSQSVKPLQVQSTLYVGAVCDRHQIPCCFASGFPSYHAMQLPPAISKRCALQAWGKSRGKTTRTLVTITYSTHLQHQRYLEAFGRLTYRLIAIGWRSTSASCIRYCIRHWCSTECR